MNFLAPAVLAGLAALSLPVIIHLLAKFRVREVRWAATRFLLTAVKRDQSKLRIRDLLLLLLRCAVLALLVFAFARPTFQPEDKIALATGAPFTVAVLLDQSASMGASDGVQTRFEAARAEALNFLAALPADSAAALFLVHDGYSGPVARPTTDIALVRRHVELARLGDRGTDFQPALHAALGALKNASGTREIHVFTDNQASGWSQVAAVRQELRSVDGVRVVLHPVAAAGSADVNLAITSLQPDTATPVAGQPFRLLAEVANFGDTPAAGVRVTLSVDGNAPSADAVIDQLAPGGSRFVPLLVRLPATGHHTLTAALPPDRLAFDNTRVFALEIAPPRAVLVVESRSGPAPWQGSGHFLASALAPVPPEEAPSYYLQVERKTAAELQPSQLSNYSVVFLCDAGPLPPAVADALDDYVEAGGGLVLMPGDATPAGAYAAAPWTDLLPAGLGLPLELPEGRLASGPYDHALLSPWNDPAAGTLAAIRVNRAYPLLETPGRDVTVPLRMADGSPFIAERAHGSGRVVLFAAPAVPAWTNLPLHPAFIPLMHRLYAVTARTTSGKLNLAPGEPFQAVVPIATLNKDVYQRVPGPDSRPVAVGRVELVGTQAVVRIRDTSAAGAHAVYIGQNEHPDILFAVQPPDGESDLRALPADILETDVDPTARPAAANSVASTPASGWRLPDDTQIWTWLIIAAAVLSLAELICALRASRTATT